MKYIPSLIWLILYQLFSAQAFSQLVYKENGIVSLAPADIIVRDSGHLHRLDTAGLNTWQVKQRARFTREMQNSLSRTLDELEDVSQPLSLVKWLYAADTNTIKNHLRSIHNNMASGSTVFLVGNTSPYYHLASTIDSILNTSLFQVNRSTTTRSITYVLKEQDIVFSFLGAYYANTLAEPANRQVLRTTLTDYYNFYWELKQQYDSVKAALQKVYTKAQPEHIEQLYASQLAFESYFTRSKFITLLRTPFFKQWLWSTGGTLRVHPLDFTASSILDTTPSMDLLSKTFTREEFIARNKKLSVENAKAIQQLQYQAKVMNRIDMPVVSNSRDQLFVVDTKDKIRSLPSIRNLDDNEKVYVTLVNVDKGYRIRNKLLNTKQLSGMSPTEEIVDTAAQEFLSLYNLLSPQTAAITGILGLLNRNRNNDANVHFQLLRPGIVSAGDIDPRHMFTTNSTTAKPPGFDTTDFWNQTRQIIVDLLPGLLSGDNSELTFYADPAVNSISLNATIFDLLRRKYRKQVQDSVATQNVKKIETLQKEIIADYLGKMYAREVAPIFIDRARTDSFYLAQLINVLSSTLPVTNIEIQTDTTPIYRSELVVIDDKATNVERTILVDKVGTGTTPDSSDLVSFSYKKVKRSLVEVSFGLSYTFQEVLTKQLNDNKVTVKNEPFRGVAALHFYPFRGAGRTRKGLYKVDEPFFGSWNRINVLVGVGVPRPLDNYYVGVGYDLGPALKLSTGLHIHKIRQYTMVNDVVTDNDPYYKVLFPFVSLSLNPQLVVNNIIAVFKN